MSWTKSEASALIALYKKCPILYDANHNHHKDRRKREQCLNEIRKKLSTLGKNTTVKDIKGKIKTMRTQYFRDKQLVTKSINRGDKVGEIYQPKFWCYFDIRFIDPDNSGDHSDHSSDTIDFDHLEDSQMIDNDISNEENSNEKSLNNETKIYEKYEVLTDVEILNDEDDAKTNLPNISTSKDDKTKCKTQDFLEENCQKSLQISQQMVQTFQNLNRSKSHLYHFTKSIETDLLALPQRLQHEAKWKIQDIVRQAQKEHLKYLETGKNNNSKTVDDDKMPDKESNIPVIKHSNIHILENIKLQSQNDSNVNALNTDYSIGTNNAFGQIGKPKIYRVLKPISKQNSTSSFPLENVSSPLILGEKSILDTAMEVLSEE